MGADVAKLREAFEEVKKGKDRASGKIRIFGHNFVSDPAKENILLFFLSYGKLLF